MSGSGCPACVGQVDVPGTHDLLTLQPRVVADWPPALQGTSEPMLTTKMTYASVSVLSGLRVQRDPLFVDDKAQRGVGGDDRRIVGGSAGTDARDAAVEQSQ